MTDKLKSSEPSAGDTKSSTVQTETHATGLPPLQWVRRQAILSYTPPPGVRIMRWDAKTNLPKAFSPLDANQAARVQTHGDDATCQAVRGTTNRILGNLLAARPVGANVLVLNQSQSLPSPPGIVRTLFYWFTDDMVPHSQYNLHVVRGSASIRGQPM